MENKIVVAVKGVIVHDNKVLIIRREANDEVGAGTWECAGGKIEFGEELESALVREIKEEVGIDVEVQNLLYATTFKSDPTRQVVIITYKCDPKNYNIKLSEEHSDYMWTSEEQFRNLVSKAIVHDMDKNNVFSKVFN